MSEVFSIDLTIVQAKAIVKALEACGVNSGDYKRMVETLGNVELANAAKSARSRVVGQLNTPQLREKATLSDVQRDMAKLSEVERLRADSKSMQQQLQQVTADLRSHHELLEHALSLIESGDSEQAKNELRKWRYPGMYTD
jgi:hypothetical protein